MEIKADSHAESDDKKLLAFESRDYRRMIVIADLDTLNAVGEGAFALGVSQGSEGMLAGLESCLNENFADISSSLGLLGKGAVNVDAR